MRELGIWPPKNLLSGIMPFLKNLGIRPQNKNRLGISLPSVLTLNGVNYMVKRPFYL
jgi:hypothetical protein